MNFESLNFRQSIKLFALRMTICLKAKTTFLGFYAFWYSDSIIVRRSFNDIHLTLRLKMISDGTPRGYLNVSEKLANDITHYCC